MLLTLIITAAAAFMITALLGIVVIPILHKLKFGQTILDIGPAWHKAKKQGTATMGGVMFIIGITAAFAVGFIMLIAGGVITLEQSDRMNIINAVSGIIMAVLFGFIGFVDDFIKVKRISRKTARMCMNLHGIWGFAAILAPSKCGIL